MDNNGINESIEEENRSTDLDNKEDIIYNAKSVATDSHDEKKHAVSGDAISVDSETAGM